MNEAIIAVDNNIETHLHYGLKILCNTNTGNHNDIQVRSSIYQVGNLVGINRNQDDGVNGQHLAGNTYSAAPTSVLVQQHKFQIQTLYLQTVEKSSYVHKINFLDDFNSTNCKLVFSDIQGRVVKTMAANSENQKVDISKFAPGIYILNLNQSNAKIAIERLIIK